MRRRYKIAIALGLVLGGIYLSFSPRVIQSSPILKGINNVRQIYFGLMLYADDHGGELPDGQTANDALRLLVSSGIIEKEDVFGCPGSSFNPDGNLGESPDFAQAIEPGENHWMYIYYPEGSAVSGGQPILVEAPDMSTGVPLWHPERAGTTEPGRTWSGGRVIVCTADGAVTTWKLAGDEPSSKFPYGKRVFDFADPELQLRHVEVSTE